MGSKAEHLVQNIGAIAEAISVFYNSISKQVPKDVALVLTQHYMDILMARRTLSPGQIAQAAALAQALGQTHKTRRKPEQPEAAQPPASPKTPEPPAQPEASQPQEPPQAQSPEPEI